MPVAAEKIEIGSPQRTAEQFIPYGATIHIEVLRHGCATRIGGQSRKPREMKLFAFCIQSNRIFGEFGPKDIAQTSRQCGNGIACLSFGAEQNAGGIADLAQLKTHVRFGHGQTFNCVGNGLQFCPICAQELEACGSRIKQIPQRDHGSCA